MSWTRPTKCALDSDEKLPLTRNMFRTVTLALWLASILAPGELRAAVVMLEGYSRTEFLATNEIRIPFTPASEIQKWLGQRKADEQSCSQKLTAFHNFKFEDRTRESGITFKHGVVDDA